MDYVDIAKIIVNPDSIVRTSYFSGIKPWNININKAISLDAALRHWTKLVPWPDDPISPGIRDSLPTPVQEAYDRHITLAGVPMHSDASDPLGTIKSLVKVNKTKKQRVAAFYHEPAVIEYLSRRAA